MRFMSGPTNAAPSGQGVEIRRQGCHERFAFARPHLGNLPLVQHDAADQLHVEVAHPRGAHTGLANNRKGFRKDFIKHFTFKPLEFVLYPVL